MVAFRVMHGALLVNAFRMHVRGDLPWEAALCPAPECSAAAAGGEAGGGPGDSLETLSHAFMRCPAAAQAVDWAWRLWGALTPGMPQPPRSAQVLLGDSRGEGWQPGADYAALWMRLRVALIGAIWESRCALGRPGAEPQPAAMRAGEIARATLARLRRMAGLAWQRVTCDIRLLSDDCPSTWFRGRDPQLSLGAFERDWAAGGRYCTAQLDPQPRMDVHVHAAWPVAVPGPGGRGDGEGDEGGGQGG